MLAGDVKPCSQPTLCKASLGGLGREEEEALKGSYFSILISLEMLPFELMLDEEQIELELPTARGFADELIRALALDDGSSLSWLGWRIEWSPTVSSTLSLPLLFLSTLNYALKPLDDQKAVLSLLGALLLMRSSPLLLLFHLEELEDCLLTGLEEAGEADLRAGVEVSLGRREESMWCSQHSMASFKVCCLLRASFALDPSLVLLMDVSFFQTLFDHHFDAYLIEDTFVPLRGGTLGFESDVWDRVNLSCLVQLLRDVIIMYRDDLVMSNP